MWFILESLPQMPLEELYEAGKMLTDGLEKMMPGLRFEVASHRRAMPVISFRRNIMFTGLSAFPLTPIAGSGGRARVQ